MPRVTAEYLAARRGHILSAAAARFARDGFHRTSMQDVIDEAGLSPGAVYRYFRSKDEIIIAISLEAIGSVERVVQEALREHRSVPDLVVGLPAAITGLDDADDRMRLAVQAWGEVLRNRDLADRMAGELARLESALRDRVEMGRRDGDVAEEVDADAVAHVLLAVVQGFILQRAWNPHLSAEAYGRAARDVVAGQLAR
ncbi:TetR/AcrR family transcriptional regulator [Nocardiopsis suaedae]|uniref:TetR/AcrR family transcriptional regulator n=1 Tax=Nocardiopsis suaedae TaxID=3018444 RepID=A0ABT4TSR3_9ACTN|nr:TetR/AcrR family transcriptional regulator [Nocardiopsis suaedae]MDA2807730.1 TetR/AcrR family transcriptional regulator [Nocardiopsis suaedae]